MSRISYLFERIGAPLRNVQWSWGAIRSDGTVFLRVWQDEDKRFDDGKSYVRVLQESLLHEASCHGYEERCTHIERILEGAECYLVMCEAVDPCVSPRSIKDFNCEEVFRAGRVVDVSGDKWIERCGRVPVYKLLPPS